MFWDLVLRELGETERERRGADKVRAAAETLRQYCALNMRSRKPLTAIETAVS